MTDDHEQRAHEGERLARSVGDPASDERLLQLLLDPQDTAVTYRTALALLTRRDAAGIELVVRADAGAEDDTSRWIGSAFLNFRAASLGADDDVLRTNLRGLATGTDERSRAAAANLLEWLQL